jgi:hypothetical protein
MLHNPQPSANLGRLDDHLLYSDSRVCTTLRSVSKSGLARWPILIIGFFHESLVAKPLYGWKFLGDSRLSPFQSSLSLLLFPLFSQFSIMQKDGKLLLLSLDSIFVQVPRATALPLVAALPWSNELPSLFLAAKVQLWLSYLGYKQGHLHVQGKD